jgi:hypothetical protein
LVNDEEGVSEMIAERKRAGAPIPARENKQHRRPALLSSPEDNIGEFLLSLAAGSGNGQDWRGFERMLSRHYGEGAGL